jgi:acetyl-CoA synthetase
MTPTQRFQNARDVLLKHRTDLAAARAAFRWPQLDTFNWATDWFDVLARGNTRDALKLVHDDGAGNVKVVRRSFEELRSRSSHLARHFVRRGVARGDRVLLMLPNVEALWAAMLACIRTGAVMVPATTQLTTDDLRDRFDRGRVTHVIAHGSCVDRFQGLPAAKNRWVVEGQAAGWVPFDDALSEGGEHVPDRPTRADEPLLLYFTSGTTAKPKLVLHTHQSYPVGHLSTMYWLGLKEGGVHQNVSSPGWAKHAWSCFFAPWNAGATVAMHDVKRFSAKGELEFLRGHGVTSLCAPPTVWRLMVLEDLGQRPPALTEVASAGEPLNPEVMSVVEKAWGLTLRDGFGQTETTAQVGNPPGQKVVPGSMGRALPGYQVVLVDAEGKTSDEGEIALQLNPRPMGLMVGYEDDPERTAAVTAGGVYRTGDEAKQDAEGYITYVGRGDDVFKSSDYRLSPFELESTLLEHPAVAEAAVVPSPDKVRLFVPKAFIVLKPGHAPDAATAKSIFEFCKQKLAPYKRIRRISFAELPKTISGKIRRVQLRRDEAAHRQAAPRDELEHLWEDQVREG